MLFLEKAKSAAEVREDADAMYDVVEVIDN